jgi:16S rRNA processing protein RimM
MGRIAGAYGVRGWLRVDPVSEDPMALLGHAQWWLRAPSGGRWQAHAVREARQHGGAIVAALEGIEAREAAARWRGGEVGVARAALPPLAPGELYWADLEGLAVVDRAERVLGEVTGMIETGAHPVLRVQPPEGAAERLIPWVPAYIDEVDLAAWRIRVDWPFED